MIESILSSLVAHLPDSFQRAVRAVALRLVLAIAPSRGIAGFTVTVLSADDEDAALEKLRVVLRLLAEVDPHRLRRMRASVGKVFVSPTLGSDGEYWHDHEALVVSSTHVLSDPIEHVAFTLVHEAAHARLRRAGIGYDEAIRARVERACVGEELAFAHKLPDSERWVLHVRRKCLDPAFWTDEAMRKRRFLAYRAFSPSRVA